MTNLTITERVEALLEKYLQYGRAGEAARIREAFALAYEAHKEQFRESGEPYVTHPLSVAEIVCEMGLDADSVIAALLHDTVEDTSVTYDDL